MNPTPLFPDDEPLAQLLRQLQPNSTPLDPAVVFYRMGLESRRQQPTRSAWPAAAALLLAASLSAVIVGPVSYRIGQASSSQSVPAAPDAEMLPLNPPQPMLAHRQPAPSAEPTTSDAAESVQAEVATIPTLPPAPATEEPTSEQLADLSSLSWPSLNAAIVNWLWGDALDRQPEPGFMLTRRLTAGHSGGDPFIDGINAPHGVVRPSDTGSGASPDVNQSGLQPKRREPLRARDWQEIVDNKPQLY